MARRIHAAAIESRTNRLKLPRQRKPHSFVNIAPAIGAPSAAARGWCASPMAMTAPGQPRRGHYEDADGEHISRSGRRNRQAVARRQDRPVFANRPAGVRVGKAHTVAQL